MQRVQYLIEKLSELSKSQRTLTAIDIDLMLDYTRVMYADLLEERKKAGFQNIEPEIKASEKAEATTEDSKIITLEETPTPATPVAKAITNDLRTVIGINDKYQFIAELFKGDKTAYEHAIKSLSNISNEEEAINWIKEELHNNNGWDADDDTVKSFYSLVSNSFS